MLTTPARPAAPLEHTGAPLTFRVPFADPPRPERGTPRRRLTRLNPWTAVIMIGLGLVGGHGQMGVEEAASRGLSFGLGYRAAPPSGALGRSADAAPAVPAVAFRAMPTGKGMWIYEFPRTEGDNVDAIVARAKATGITHVYPRLGSHWDGFNARQYMDAFLPAAHAAGIKVFGWDFPRLGDSMPSDIDRAREMINYTSSSGHRLDGFSADIETISEGSHVSPEGAVAYGQALRDIAGPDFTLIATVPRPSRNHPDYPYGEIVQSFDAIAPMTYWLNRQPDTDVIGAMDDLAQFGKPIFPVGQAYDGGPEGGRDGVPSPEELQRFMRTAADKGASGVSFWSWQAADDAAWTAIRDAFEFRGPGQAPV